MENERKIRSWCIIGFLTIVILGSMLHFVFEWTNRSVLAGIFVPVNESVWEHLKLGFWSLVAFSAIEYWSIWKYVANYFFAKALGTFILSSTILVIFYTCTSFVGKSILIVDISSYATGAFVCQFLIYRLYKSKPLHHATKIGGVVFLTLSGLLFAVFTFFPPHKSIFMDKTNNTFGITMERSGAEER